MFFYILTTSIALPLIIYLMIFTAPILYKKWQKISTFIRYILFLPVSLALGFLVTFIYFVMLSYPFRSEFITNWIYPPIIVAMSQFFTSLLIIFLAPKHEKKLLRVVLIFAIVVGNISWWMVLIDQSRLGLNKELFLSVWSVIVSSSILWNSKELVRLKLDLKPDAGRDL